MKKADRSEARLTLIIGQDEVDQGVCQVKDMLTGEQETCAFDDVVSYISNKL